MCKLYFSGFLLVSKFPDLLTITIAHMKRSLFCQKKIWASLLHCKFSDLQTLDFAKYSADLGTFANLRIDKCAQNLSLPSYNYYKYFLAKMMFQRLLEYTL